MTRAGFPALRMTCLPQCWRGCWSERSHAEDMPQVAVRVGNHPGFGRVVFDLPGQVEYELTQQGQHVTIEFKRDLTIGSAPSAPHNVQNITGGKGRAEFDVVPGTTVRASRMGDRVVIDVADGCEWAGVIRTTIAAGVTGAIACIGETSVDPGGGRDAPGDSGNTRKGAPAASGSQIREGAATNAREGSSIGHQRQPRAPPRRERHRHQW